VTHWRDAIAQLGLGRGLRVDSAGENFRRPEFLVKKPRTRKSSHLIIEMRVEPLRNGNWAETSLMMDGPYREDYVRARFVVPKSVKIHGNVMSRHIVLSPRPIPQSEFHTRYPDVPYKLAHTFVLAHELGHAMSGWREAAADRYAFRRLVLAQDPKAKKLRDAVYGKIKHPGSFMKWPE
jgi:hypothetical protein